jgi:hypothetical protein
VLKTLIFHFRIMLWLWLVMTMLWLWLVMTMLWLWLVMTMLWLWLVMTMTCYDYVMTMLWLWLAGFKWHLFLPSLHNLFPIKQWEWLSELLNANSAIFQLYHGENKLIFNEMVMRSALYLTNMLSWIFIVLAHWNNSLQIDMSPHSDTLSWFRAN